jgi:hypothetical protein
MKTDEEFKTFYESELVQKAVLLEGLRLKTKRNLTAFYILLSIVISMSAFIVVYLIYESIVCDNDKDLGIVYKGPFADTADPVKAMGSTISQLILFNLALFLVVYAIKRDYRLSFRKNIILPMLDFFNKGLTYMPEKEFNYKAIEISSLFNNMGNYVARDYIEGTVDKSFVQMTVLDLEHGLGSGDDAFKGLVLLTPLNAAPLEDKIMVYSWLHDDVYIDLYQKDTMTLKPENYGTDSFKKEFTTFTTNKASLAGVLTPSVMEWMLQVKAQAGDRVCFSFTHHNMFMALHCKSIFEPSIYKPVKEEDVFLWAKTFHVALQAITNFEAIKPHAHA